MAEAGEHFDLYSGDDAFTLPLLACGADGVVGTSTHWTATEGSSSMIEAFHARRRRRGTSINARLQPFIRLHQQRGMVFSMSIKAMLRTLGQEVGKCRLP